MGVGGGMPIDREAAGWALCIPQKIVQMRCASLIRPGAHLRKLVN